MKERVRRIPLSPNEEAQLIRDERDRRRKLRLVQVRQQAKLNAAQIRREVKVEREKQLCMLAAEIKDEWEAEKAERVRKLEEQHMRSLCHVGDAHVRASQQEPMDVARHLVEQENLQRAARRHLEAIQRMKEEKLQREQHEKQHNLTRQAALDLEKERAAEIAALPPPKPDPVEKVEMPKVRPIKLTDLNAFAHTYYHMEDYAVERATADEQTDAKMAAMEEEARIGEVEASEKVSAHERAEKARLRHQVAWRKELLSHDYDAMLLELSDLHRADISRRQQVVARIPKSVYQAPQRRLEEKEEDQREMEAAFEDMYMAATEHQGNLTLALERHPPPAVTPASSSALDLSLDPGVAAQPDSLGDFQQRALPLRHPLKDMTNLSNKSRRGENDSVLGRLTSKIQAQRQLWASRSSPAADSPRDQPDQRIFAPVAQDFSSTTTGGTLSQFTMTLDTGSSRTVTTVDEESTELSSITTITGSKVSSVPTSQLSSVTVTDSDVTTTTMDTQEGAVTSMGASLIQSDTLLHPIEMAAKVRHHPLDNGLAHMTAFLGEKKLGPGLQPSLEQQLNELRQEQLRVNRDRKELEQKLKNLKTSFVIKQSKIICELDHQTMPSTSIKDYVSKPYIPTQECAMPEAGARLPVMSSFQTLARLQIPMEEKVRLYKERAIKLYKEQKQSMESPRITDSLAFDSGVEKVSPISSSLSSFSLSGPLKEDVPSGCESLSSTSVDYGMDEAQPVSESSSSTQFRDLEWSQFDSRQASLKAQLAEIQLQRFDILSSQQRHQEEMSNLKERWQHELDRYSVSDSLSLEGRMSLLTSPERIECEGAFVHQQEMGEEEMMLSLNNLPPQAVDHKYKISRIKPTAKVIKVPNKSPVLAHELSTIQELDTPATDKKTPSEHLNSSKRETCEKHVMRTLFQSMDEVPEEETAPSVTLQPTSSTRYEPPAYMAGSGLGLFEAPYNDYLSIPQQLSQLFTKDPSEADVLSASRSDDLSEDYGVSDMPTWVGLESKVVERPLLHPSTDRIVEVDRQSGEMPEQLISPKLPPLQDSAAFSINTSLSTGLITEDGEYHPCTTGITLSSPVDEKVDEFSIIHTPTEQRSVPHDSQEETPKAEVSRSPNHPLGKTETSPRPGFSSLYVPLQGKEKQKNWKKELAQYHISYLTPPKTSPARNTDKIQRCITTRAFGCERPIKGTAKTKEEMEAAHRANLMPVSPMRKVFSPEENMSPSRIRQMFENASKNLFQSPIQRDKPPSGFAKQVQFLSSTSASNGVTRHLQTGMRDMQNDQEAMEEPGQASARGGSQSLFGMQSLMGDNESPITSADASELSQHQLASDSNISMISYSITNHTESSLEHVPLTTSHVSDNTAKSGMTLSQFTLDDSRRASGATISPLTSNLALQGHEVLSHLQPLMEMSRSTVGSPGSNERQPYQSLDQFPVSPNPQALTELSSKTNPQVMNWPASSAQSQNSNRSSESADAENMPPSNSEAKGNTVNFASEISHQAEVTMEKYDRRMEESQTLRRKYEADEQVLMAGLERAYQQQEPEASGARWEQDLSKSFERLVGEETGISDEPDLTLVSGTTTPRKNVATTPIIDTLTESDDNTLSQPRSLLSFEQHEQTQRSQRSTMRARLSGAMESCSLSTSNEEDTDQKLSMPSLATGSSVAAGGHMGPSQTRRLAEKSIIQASKGHLKETLASWKKKNAMQCTNVSSDSSGSMSTQGTDSTVATDMSVSMTTKTTADAKKKEREIKARTERLYSQLNDVRAQRQEQQRHEEYAANRQRRLEYQKKLQQQMKMKSQSKKE